MIYELHITTDPDADVARFIATCADLDVKPLLIELEGGGENPRQLMTAAVFEVDDDGEAILLTAELESELLQAGFPALRVKLEVPLDKAAPYKFPRYHEAHIKCLLLPEEVEANIAHAHAQGWITSRNALFRSDGGYEKWYFTQRYYGNSFRAAGEFFASSYAYLNLRGRVRMEKETVIFDSNPDLDRGWA